jgi:hypothetical protein
MLVVLVILMPMRFMSGLRNRVRGFRKVDSGFGHLAEIRPRFVLLHDRHTAGNSESTSCIPGDDSNLH